MKQILAILLLLTLISGVALAQGGQATNLRYGSSLPSVTIPGPAVFNVTGTGLYLCMVTSCTTGSWNLIVAGAPTTANVAAISSGQLVSANGHQVTGPLNCADTSGSGTAQVCNTSPTFTPAANDCIVYTTTTANTGTGLTLNVNSLGAKPVAKWQGTTTLAANDVLANKYVLTCYDGTNWELATIGNAPGGGGISGLTTSKIPKATSSTAIGDSSITDNGTTVATTLPIVIGTANVTTFGSGGGFGLGEGTAPTNVASTTSVYADSTQHELMAATAGSSTFGILNRTVGTVNLTSKTATQSISTLCAASAGACNVAGQYVVNYNFWGSGTACSSVTAGKVVLTLTWTDEAGTSHSAIPVPIAFDQKSAAGNVTGTFNFNTSLATEGAAGDYIVSTNGAAAIQYTATYTACTTGTGTYNLRISAVRVQ